MFDIIEGCRHIEQFTSSIDFEKYTNDALIKSAVERHFINIGEALNRIKQSGSKIFETITDAAQIIGFRNILVHGYDVVSDQLVWGIIVENLPKLKAQCEKKLNL